jgi:SAM-dependent methyltransferase
LPALSVDHQEGGFGVTLQRIKPVYRLDNGNLSWRSIAEAGLDRFINELEQIPDGPRINLGAGNKEILDTTPVDVEHGWLAGNRMEFEDESVAAIYAFHFFEHLDKWDIIDTLRECERILMVGGSLFTVIPHWSAELAYKDLDHKSHWSEGTWDNLFNNTYYDGTMPRDWRLREHATLLMGLVQRNLVIVSQLVKDV